MIICSKIVHAIFDYQPLLEGLKYNDVHERYVLHFYQGLQITVPSEKRRNKRRIAVENSFSELVLFYDHNVQEQLKH